MSIEAVIFDVGGVLFHQRDRTQHQMWEQRLGLAAGQLSSTIWTSEVSRRAEIGLATEDEIWAAVAQQFNLDDLTALQLRAAYFAGGTWDTDLIDFARSLRSRVKTGVISNAWPNARTSIREYVNETMFDDLIFSAEVGLAKPDRRIFASCARSIGRATARGCLRRRRARKHRGGEVDRDDRRSL